MEGEFHFNKQEKKYLRAFPGMLVVFQVLEGMDRMILASECLLEAMNLSYDELATYFVNGFRPLLKYSTLEGETKYFAGKAIAMTRKHATLRFVTYADVTTLYEKLEALEDGIDRGESFYKQILDTTSSAIFWKDKDRRFRGANRAFLEAYGFKSEDEIIGKTDEDMGWHPDPDYFKQREEDILSGKEHGPARTKNLIQGRERDIIAMKAPIYGSDGSIQGLVGSFLDITDLAD